jgi:NADH:ubiquinone oxidoreductase subunit 5 (subunit L)/multisubunit Na+/H+ antiporter MnhA subunit
MATRPQRSIISIVAWVIVVLSSVLLVGMYATYRQSGGVLVTAVNIIGVIGLLVGVMAVIFIDGRSIPRIIDDWHGYNTTNATKGPAKRC